MLVVDEDSAFRQSVCSMVGFGERPSLVAAAGSLTDAKRAIAASDFDVALVDWQLVDGSAIEVVQEIARSRPETPLMMVAVFGEKARLLASLEAASIVFSSDAVEPAKNKTPAEDAPSDADKLSARELEVLQLIARGFKVDQVATYLELASHTVATHVKHIYRKMKVHSRASCIYEATRAGLIT